MPLTLYRRKVFNTHSENRAKELFPVHRKFLDLYINRIRLPLSSPHTLLIYVVLTYLLTYLITYLVTPRGKVLLEKLIGSSTSPETPHILWNLEGHYRVLKCLPPVPILSHISPVHALITNVLKSHLNIILQ